jgi:hypothetical protein
VGTSASDAAAWARTGRKRAMFARDAAQAFLAETMMGLEV